MSRCVFILVFFSWQLQAGISFSAELPGQKDFYLIRNLLHDLQVYDDKYEANVPYIASRHQNTRVINSWLDLKGNRDYDLIFWSYPDLHLFIDQGLSKRFSGEGWMVLPIDSLYRVVKKDKIYLTFYDETRRLPLPALFVGTKVESKTQMVEEMDSLSPFDYRKKSRRSVNHTLTLLAWVVLVFHTLILHYNRRSIIDFYSLRSSLSNLSRKDGNLINKPLNQANLLILGGHALVISIVYSFGVFQGKLGNLGAFWSMSSVNTTGEGIGIIGLLMCVILGLFILKYTLCASMGGLLSLSRFNVHTHFFEYVRLSILFYSSLYLVLILFYQFDIQYYTYFAQIFLYSVMGFHILQMLVVCFYIIKLTDYTSLYLFYYLCMTELVPLLIGLKILIL